jgi:ubiquitin C-terminal hydrolase
MLFSQESQRMEKHYKYRGDLPKLTFTRSAISKIYSNPINFFVISIARENNDGTKNELELINLPEHIKICGKTLELVSAITHYGKHISTGHYVCYFKCGNHWYIMNNMHDNITQHTAFDIKNREIMSKCRLLIYM